MEAIADPKQLLHLLEQLDEVYVIFSTDYTKLVHLSPSAGRKLGIPIEDSEDNPLGLLRFLHEDDRPRIAKAIEQRRSGAFSGKRVLEFRIVTVGGKLRWLKVSVSPLPDDNGDISLLAARIEDVTEQHRRTQDLDMLFNLVPDMLCVASLDGHFLRVNPAFERVLGYSSEELRARPFIDFVYPEDRDSTLKELAKLGKGPTSTYFSNRYQRKDGGTVSLEWSSMPCPEADVVYAIARIKAEAGSP